MIALPAPKPEVLARREQIVAALRALVPGDGVISDAVRLKPYETDGLAAYRQPPLAVVLPSSTEQVAAVLRYCHENGVRVVPRGAGTSLSGGALPLADAASFNPSSEIASAVQLSAEPVADQLEPPLAET